MTSLWDDGRLDRWNVGVEIRKGRGRCLIAKKSFHIGETVFKNEPYAKLLNANRNLCSQCFRSPAPRLLRCTGCKVLSYCSRECQRRSWKDGHKEECISLRTWQETIGDRLDEARLILRCLVRRDRDCENKESKALRSTYDDVLAMHVPRALKTGKHIISTARKLKKSIPRFDGLSAEAIAKFLNRFQANNFAITDAILSQIGSAVYPAGALINHSCDPNTVIYYEPITSHQVFRCVRPIKEGDEITHAYVDVLNTTKERRSQLMKDYCFRCECSLCEDENGPQRDAMLCSSPTDTSSTVELMLAEKFARAAMVEVDLVKEQALLARCAALRSKHLHPLSLVRLKTSNAQFAASLQAGNIDDAARHCATALNTYVRLYPNPYHPIPSTKRFALGQLYLQLGRVDVAAKELEKAHRALLVTHGADSELVKSLNEILIAARRGI